MTEAVPELQRFGAVEGSAAFDRSALRPMPQLRVGVSVESGLLEIELLTKDMAPEELLAVLESYRQKKKYHRLSSGAFVLPAACARVVLCVFNNFSAYHSFFSGQSDLFIVFLECTFSEYYSERKLIS